MTPKFTGSRRGDISEIIASAWLLQEGYEVFRNLSCCGPMDIVAVDTDGNTLFIDVKTVSRDKRGCYNIKVSEKQEELGVLFLMVEDGHCFWHES